MTSAALGTRAQPFVKSRRIAVGSATVEAIAVGAVSYAVYVGVGLFAIHRSVVVHDALSRLAHAYFVWHNAPPKLAAIGFVWPPIETMAFLPFALVRPVATSMLALPLTSGLFAAGLLVYLDRLFSTVGMRRVERLSLLAGFGLNPMIVFYAANGMGEMVHLFFLVVAATGFVRWYLHRRSKDLILIGVALSLGVLSRYELVAWAAVLVPALTIAMIRQRVSRSELEGSLVAYLAPVGYGIGLWLFFNWLIVGSAFFWLHHQTPGAGVGPGATPAEAQPVPHSLAGVAGEVISLNTQLFPLAPAVFCALAVLFLFRRELMSLTMLALVGLNAAFTTALVYATESPYFQLRYNMRAMPLALVGVAWLYVRARGRGKQAVWAASLVVLLASIPAGWHTMQTYRWQFLELSFTRALSSGEDQEGTQSRGGYDVGVRSEQRMGEYIRGHVRARDAILTDDGQTFGVMLFSGRPDLFFDRIDRGDVKWFDTLESPYGRVRYVLTSDIPSDVLRRRYPQLAYGTVPGFRRVYSTPHFTLLRVAPFKPGRRHDRVVRAHLRARPGAQAAAAPR